MSGTPAGFRRMPVWVKIVLALSLGVNLIVLGTLAGSALRSDRVRSVPFATLGMRGAIRNLPEAERKAFLSRADELRPELEPLVKSIRQGREKLVALLKAEPFDADAVRALFAHQRETRNRATTMTSEVIVEALAALSPQARQLIAEEVAKTRRRRR